MLDFSLLCVCVCLFSACVCGGGDGARMLDGIKLKLISPLNIWREERFISKSVLCSTRLLAIFGKIFGTIFGAYHISNKIRRGSYLEQYLEGIIFGPSQFKS